MAKSWSLKLIVQSLQQQTTRKGIYWNSWKRTKSKRVFQFYFQHCFRVSHVNLILCSTSLSTVICGKEATSQWEVVTAFRFLSIVSINTLPQNLRATLSCASGAGMVTLKLKPWQKPRMKWPLWNRRRGTPEEPKRRLKDVTFRQHCTRECRGVRCIP